MKLTLEEIVAPEEIVALEEIVRVLNPFTMKSSNFIQRIFLSM